MTSIDLNSPLQKAVEQMAARTVTGSPMTSREWELLPAEVRLRSMFSARVEHERTLAEMQGRIVAGLAGEKAGGATMDKARFVEEMRAFIKTTGYKRPDGTRRKSIQNLRSRARLELIWEMNTAQARGYSRWLKDMETLESAPCYELIRVRQRAEVRDWPLVWRQAGGEFYGPPGKDYPGAPGRMIARKTDPIWVKISRFGVPWPPFDWGSGMGLRHVLLDEAEELGVIDEDEPPQEPQPRPFNQGHSASAKAIPEPGRESLRSAFGDAIKFDNERIMLQREATPESHDQRKSDITESLRRRARAIAAAGEDAFGRGSGSGDRAVALPSGLRTAEGRREILASASAVAVGRKALYHEQWVGYAQAIADLLREFLPDAVAVMVRDGHVHAWRPDLLDSTPEQIHGLALSAENGRLLGYGQNLFDQPAVAVNLLDEAGRVIGGFFARPDTARTFARLRARDFSDALGIPVRIAIDGKEARP